MKRKILSFLLAASMLVTAQGIPTLAGSVTSGNEVNGTGTVSTANPVHHCTGEDDGSDYTDWSYVYFGSYPQTEVTGTDLTAAISGANYDANGDAWVNGIKYHRVSKSGIYRYFKWERIKWRVLQNNGDTLFVVADKGLDCKDYNETSTSSTWETCTLRTWLNETFYSFSFSKSEQEAIVQQMVVNDETDSGNNTQDKIYLLSKGEVINPEYGFCRSTLVKSASRWMQASEYAHVMGVPINKDGNYNYSCSWWLRSPDTHDRLDAETVSSQGMTGHTIYGSGYHFAIMPALHINLNSDLWYTSDDGTSGDGGSMGNETFITNNPVSQIAYEGISTTFNVTADGSNPSNYTYQWYYASSETGTGTKITGATASSYIIPPDSVNESLNGSYYYCMISDGISTLTSDRAKLTVYFPPTVSISENQRVTIDDSVEFSVTASGGNPTDYTYQWYYTAAVIDEGMPIKGATSAIYKIPQGEVTANLDGLFFYCIVSNGQYTVRSDNAKLTIYEAVPGETPPGDSSGNTSGGTTSGGDTDSDDNNNNSSSGDSSTSGDNSSSGDNSTSGDNSSSGDSSSSGNNNSSSNGSNSGNTSSSGNGSNSGNTNSSGNNTSSSGSGSGTAADTSVKLTAPKLTVKLSASNAVKLSWNQISGAAGYILYRSDSKTGKFTKIASVTGTSYTDTKLKKGKTYYYKVVAYAKNTTSKESNVVSKKIIGKLTRPKLQKISIVPGGKFTVSWKNIKNAQKIEIQISIDGGKYKKWKTVAAKKGKATYSYLSFSRNHKYSFKLRAYYKADGKKIYSKTSNAYAIIRN